MTDTYESTRNNENFVPDGAGSGGPQEKDFENGNGSGGYHEHLPASMDPGTALRKIQTSGSISISPELFEKIYLSPENRVSGDLRKTFGNPTPYALVGFLISLTPLSCDLMGWRGAGNFGASDIGAYLTFGGILMTLGSIGEFILGNTFPMVVFGSFGAFWLTFGLTLYPSTGAWSLYNGLPGPDGTTVKNGLLTAQFRASFGFWLLFMGVLCLIYTILSLRTNILFFLILVLLPPAFGCLTAAFWYYSEGSTPYKVNAFLIAAGALTFVVDLLGWYLFTAIMFAALDFPIQLPVGDLSHVVKGKNEKAKLKRQAEREMDV